MRIPWTESVRNEVVWERTGQIPVVDEVGRRRWRWIGHTLRRHDNNIARQALRWNPQGQRRRGRPRMTWWRSFELEMKAMDTLGLTSPRWLGIEMVGRCLFVAYTLIGVKGNDDDDDYSLAFPPN